MIRGPLFYFGEIFDAVLFALCAVMTVRLMVLSVFQQWVGEVEINALAVMYK